MTSLNFRTRQANTAAERAASRRRALAREGEVIARLEAEPCGGAGVAIMDIRTGECRWPMWRGAAPTDLEQIRFCGEPTEGATCSYCSEHHAVATGRPTGSLTDSRMLKAAREAVRLEQAA